jgi:hypothetical protein
MNAIHIYDDSQSPGAVLCGTNNVGAAIRIDQLSLFTPGEVCRECMAKAQSLRQGERRE